MSFLRLSDLYPTNPLIHGTLTIFLWPVCPSFHPTPLIRVQTPPRYMRLTLSLYDPCVRTSFQPFRSVSGNPSIPGTNTIFLKPVCPNYAPQICVQPCPASGRRVKASARYSLSTVQRGEVRFQRWDHVVFTWQIRRFRREGKGRKAQGMEVKEARFRGRGERRRRNRIGRVGKRREEYGGEKKTSKEDKPNKGKAEH